MKPLDHTDFNDWELTFLAMIECIKQEGVREAKIKTNGDVPFNRQFLWEDSQQRYDFWDEAYFAASRRPLQSKPERRKK